MSKQEINFLLEIIFTRPRRRSGLASNLAQRNKEIANQKADLEAPVF